MDPDAPPLVKADGLASQGEQLSSRRAYQQAHGAHTEAAKQYQLAAQATGDTSAAKALLLQRDKQLKLAAEVLRKLERGKSKPVTPAGLASGAVGSVGQSTHPPYANRTYNAAHQHHHQPSSNVPTSPHGRRTNFQQQQQQAITANIGHGQQQVYNPSRVGHVPFSARDRPDASTMADSRYSRKSNSPSQSQISHSVPHSGESVRTSSVEESYYLMKPDNDPADPVTTFLTVVENMVEELGNAVAFASAPLHIGPPAAKLAGYTTALAERTTADGPLKSDSGRIQSQSKTATTNAVLESFYVIPPVTRPGTQTREDLSSGDGAIPRPNSASNKTHEELVAENATLKETLDHLSKRLDWITKERQREKETLKDSVTIFARDVRRQAERLGQSTANLADARRQMPSMLLPPASHAQAASNLPLVEELQRKLVQAQGEAKAAKAEAEKQTANAQRYKSRYDDLRKAILEKRKAKEMAMAAASQSKEGGDSAATSKVATETANSTALAQEKVPTSGT